MSVSPDVHSAPNMKSQGTPTVDSEREEFRKYLESSGILDVLTKILKELYEKDDKPVDPLSYLTNTLAAVNFDSREVVALEDEIQELKGVIENLEKENAQFREINENLEKENAHLREKLDKI